MPVYYYSYAATVILSYHYYPELSGNKCICIHITFDLNVLGRRGAITLAHILMFATCVDEEPTLGFKVQPSINFTEATGNDNFITTANTCICSLTFWHMEHVYFLYLHLTNYFHSMTMHSLMHFLEIFKN